jgi:hypothetical protein
VYKSRVYLLAENLVNLTYIVKKKLSEFPVPTWDVSLFLAGNNLITVFPARESLVRDIPARDGKIVFYSVI